jgi:hypothetical protein
VYPTYDVAGVLFNAVRSAAFAWTKKFLPILEKALGRTVELPKRQIHSAEEFLAAFPDVYPIAKRISRRRHGAQVQSRTRRTAQAEHWIDELGIF